MKTNWPAFRCGCLILSSAVLGASPLLAQTQEPAGATATAAVISSVAITHAPQRASVRVEGEGRLDVHPLRMQNPERLVLDFSGARLAVDKTVIPGSSEPVRDVRVGQYRPNVARVVVDLTGVSPYQISREGAAVVVFFDQQPEAPSETPSNPQTIASQQDTKTRAAFEYSASIPRVSARPATNLQIPAPRFALPSELTQPSVSLASFGGRRNAASTAKAQEAAQQAAQQSSAAANTLAASSRQEPQTQATPAPVATGKYTGEPISVNLKDVDLRDFFRLIHEISGLNVVLDPAVKGTLTIVLDEVPWDQALDIVLQNNGLDKQLNGNVLRIATHETLRKEAETERDLARAQSEAINPTTTTRVLSYAKASTLAGTLKKFLSTRGDIIADDRSNQLIIRDIPSVFPTIDNLIRQLDRKSQQVEIEARVISASRSFAQDIGTELGFAGTTTSGRDIFGGAPQVGVSPG
ncbi:MAG: AMIN domain-containing protein, partial [Candidatus Acidiferrum sp.]